MLSGAANFFRGTNPRNQYSEHSVLLSSGIDLLKKENNDNKNNEIVAKIFTREGDTSKMPT